MAKTARKLPVATEKKKTPPSLSSFDWQPLEKLREEIDHIFNDFRLGKWSNRFLHKPFDVEPFWRHDPGWGATPAIDIAEKKDAFEITAELPGMDEKNIDVQLSGDMLVIKGEKTEKKEEKKKDYFLSERRFGSFHRSFRLPDGVDVKKIGAQFKNGVLTLTLPKSGEVVKQGRKIKVTAM